MIRPGVVLLSLLVVAISVAQVAAQAGPYRISLTSQPRVVPVGQAKLLFRITDASGSPAEGLQVRAIARMPGMFMGEREQTATQVSGQPGTYSVQAAFPMAGLYEVGIKIEGEGGEATTALPLNTGQDTGGQTGGSSITWILLWLAALAAVAFVIYRMRATGQKLSLSSIVNRTTIGSLLLLTGLFAIAMYAVEKWRRPGSMTPIEAQVMEMNTPAPPGTSAVELATVTRGRVAETVRYTGQAVGFTEQDVNPRVTGVVLSIPVYVGDRVKKGQVLARLDTSQLDPQLAERAAMTNMAAQGVAVAASEYEAALQEVAEARAEIGVKQSSVAEAEAMLEASRQEKVAMESEVVAVLSDVSNARAGVEAASQRERYATDELARMRELHRGGAVSRSELQMAESETADAVAQLHSAQQMVLAAEAKVTAARSGVRKAEAMVTAAERRVRMAKWEVQAARAAVVSRQKAAEAAKRNVDRERAAVAQARAGYQSATAQRGYAALKAEVDGVVTQRLVSPGTLVNPGQTVFKVSQVKPIRLQANVPLTDLSRIMVGSAAKIAVQGVEESVEARVTSVSPAIDPLSRTGIVEVVWANEDLRFLPGQFVSMSIRVGEPDEGLVVPTAAIQHPAGGAKPFVWLASPSGEPGRYRVKRVEVEPGATDGKLVAIGAGLSEGQRIVVSGGTYLREDGEVSAAPDEVSSKGPIVEVFASGFKPDVVEVAQGKPVTITFIRRSEEGCGTEVFFPDLKLEKPLPLNKTVEVTLTPSKKGELKFSCGMDMMRGKVVVR